MPVIDLDAIPQSGDTHYPPPYDRQIEGRRFRRLGPAAGLTHLGASHVVLKPGAWSSQRHWHAGIDELLVMLSGEAVLVENAGRRVLRPGDIVAWAAGVENGHHLINESDADCSFVAVSASDGSKSAAYPDIDLAFSEGAYSRRDGTPYTP